MAVGDLCTLANVRQAMETPTADTSLDALVSVWIESASELIMQETQREFAPVTTAATRDFRVSGTSVVDLAPYDLRTVTAVTLDPGSSAQVLVSGTDYQLMPIGSGKWSVFTEVRLSRYLSVAAIRSTNGLGLATLRIAGAWGFASVPPVAREACVFTVRSWLRRSYPDGYAMVADDALGLQTPLSGYAIPLAAKTMLRPLYRNIVGVF